MRCWPITMARWSRSTSVQRSPAASPRRSPRWAISHHSAYSRSSATDPKNATSCWTVHTATAERSPRSRQAVVGPHQGLRPARGGLDHASLDTLAFAVQRLASEPLVLLLAARGTAAPAGFTRDFPELLLPPLSVLEARRLLDAQPHPPRG